MARFSRANHFRALAPDFLSVLGGVRLILDYQIVNDPVLEKQGIEKEAHDFAILM